MNAMTKARLLRGGIDGLPRPAVPESESPPVVVSKVFPIQSFFNYLGQAVGAQALISQPPGTQIVNPQPYARKIEGATASKKTGRAKRRGISRKARAGVYRPVLRALVNRYSKSMFFDFKYVKLNTGVKVWGKSGSKRVQRDQVYPALQFFIRPTGSPN